MWSNYPRRYGCEVREEKRREGTIGLWEDFSLHSFQNLESLRGVYKDMVKTGWRINVSIKVPCEIEGDESST